MKQLQKSDLKEGEIYVTNISLNDNHTYEYLNKHSLNGRGYGLDIKHKNDFRHDWVLSYSKIREATPEEKHWLETCIKENKFISYEETMKTFVPEYIQCVARWNDFTIGKIYTFPRPVDDKNNIRSVIVTWEDWKNIFKPSTKEAYDAQFKEPEFVLPEKWCVKDISEHEIDIVCEYGNKMWSTPNYNCKTWKPSMLTKMLIGNYDHAGRPYFVTKDFSHKHIEITFDQFKQYVLKENTTITEKPKVVFEESKDKVLQLNQIRGKGTTIVQVQCSEGGVYKIGDKITVFDKTSPNKGKPFTIKGFRWNNAKTNLCAITELHSPNGIGLDKIELYVEPRVEITHNFKIGDKISINANMVNKNLFIIENIEGNRLIINNEKGTLHNFHKSVLAKNVKLVEPKQELSLLEQAKLKYPIGTKVKSLYDSLELIISEHAHTNYKEGYCPHKNTIWWRSTTHYCPKIYDNGKWAEIVDDFVLPEKWCVEVNQEIRSKFNYCFAEGYHHSIQINDTNKWSYKIKEGFTEITFEQFKKYVLKDE